MYSIYITVSCWCVIIGHISCNDFNISTEIRNVDVLEKQLSSEIVTELEDISSTESSADESNVLVANNEDVIFDDLESNDSYLQQSETKNDLPSSVAAELSEPNGASKRIDSGDDGDSVNSKMMQNYEYDGLKKTVNKRTSVESPTVFAQELHLNGTLVSSSAKDFLWQNSTEPRRAKSKSNYRKVVRKPGQTSLVIVFDGTGSMENCLIQLRSGAKMIIEKFANEDENPIYNYIFVPFRDPRKEKIPLYC